MCNMFSSLDSGPFLRTSFHVFLFLPLSIQTSTSKYFTHFTHSFCSFLHVENECSIPVLIISLMHAVRSLPLNTCLVGLFLTEILHIQLCSYYYSPVSLHAFFNSPDFPNMKHCTCNTQNTYSKTLQMHFFWIMILLIRTG